MIIHVVNPNSTAAMTEKARLAAVACAAPGTRIMAGNPRGTPASIEGHADEAVAVPAMLALIAEAEAEGADAHVIACFDDPGLHAAREIAEGPVIGICQAGMQVAMSIAARFSIVTTLPRSVPIIEDLVAAYGAGHHCRRVRAADLEVLALESDPVDAYRKIAAQIRMARDEDGAEAVVLGCAGMTDLADRLARETGIPVIESVTAAVKLAEALAAAQFRTSKVGSYAFPRQKAGGAAQGLVANLAH
ncbi:aspartate/glutamate racemase family protein [Paracoccus suum]|uniref:Hydantoin racemase n=1 Tax=Paracoccus suum TaxID=2259340 RepID=A0A344PKK7_9RHOB|nr:aspartate/glutamate racemase family protein [Paracoccus suum]AXC49912.1 aspartate/glutamate racemase family protein [Paracoccus suum]